MFIIFLLLLFLFFFCFKLREEHWMGRRVEHLRVEHWEGWSIGEGGALGKVEGWRIGNVEHWAG